MPVYTEVKIKTADKLGSQFGVTLLQNHQSRIEERSGIFLSAVGVNIRNLHTSAAFILPAILLNNLGGGMKKY
jgi:hypothetical protein